MNGKDVIRNLTSWLETRTGDAGFQNEEVGTLIIITLGTRKKPRGWKQVINTNLTLGSGMAEEMLEDITSLTPRQFLVKYTNY